MPAKRVIILNRVFGSMDSRAVLWADVPAGNQIAYRNPAAVSAYENAAPAEVQAIRDGAVAEKVVTYNRNPTTTTLATMQADLQPLWTAFQNEVTAVVAWSEYGSFWDGATWAATPGVPMFNMPQTSEGLPSFFALTPVSAFAASKFQFVLYNAVNPLAFGLVVKVRLLVVIPGVAVVTGVQSSVWTLQRRAAMTTAPSGAGLFAPARTDSAAALPAGIGCYNAPAVSPAGGTLETFNQFLPQADEMKLSTLDAPTMAGLAPFGGQIIYNCNSILPSRPLTVRAGETLEIVQSVTAGTGNCQILCVFTVG